MSKSKGNYPVPSAVFNRYGVDALRFYLLTSPVMAGENLAFSEKEIDEIYKKLILILHNVLAFLRTYSSEKVFSMARHLSRVAFWTAGSSRACTSSSPASPKVWTATTSCALATPS